MKLIIDIPEEIVTAIQNGQDYRYDIHTAIAQGKSCDTSGDLISREGLKKALHNFFDGKIIDEPAYILRDVFCYIDNAPTVPLPDFKAGYKQAILDGQTNFNRSPGEWISVNERLPEINVDVIVTDIETTGTYSAYYLGDGLWECDNGPYNNRIIAWMSFPEPYIRGEEE